MTGRLIYDSETQRLAIVSDGETEPLHCGTVIEVRSSSGAEWATTRVEANESGEWYLVGLYRAGNIPAGLQARL